MTLPGALLLLALAPAGLDRMPAWARPAITAALEEPPPPESDAWVLLHREEISYAGEGRIRTVTRRVLQLLSERSVHGEDLVVAGTMGGKAGKVRRIRADNLRPGGEVETVDKNDTATLGDGFTQATAAALSHAQKGSFIAVEMEVEEEPPIAPIALSGVMMRHPVRVFEIAVSPGKADARIDARHLDPWISSPTLSAQFVRLTNVPALPKDESAAPHERNSSPWVLVRYLDPTLAPRKADMSSWDGLAVWTADAYAKLLSPSREVSGVTGTGLDALKGLRAWFSREMTYRQLYLTPERGLLPLPAGDTIRRRYGDCKDLATAFMSEAAARGFGVAPVLARIVEGRVEDDEPPNYAAFNHVIAAIRVDSATGLPSEVTTPGGRFVLVDPTSRTTPWGLLPIEHRGRRLLICTSSGGQWVRVSDEAVPRPVTRYEVDGRLDSDFSLTGTLRVIETGESAMRSAALDNGAKGLREACLELGFKPEASCDVRERSDPLDIDRPFSVLFDIVQPGAAWKVVSTEIVLAPPGFPWPPNLIQKAGKPRKLPVELERTGVIEHRLTIETPYRLGPVLPEERGESPLRRYEITAKTTPNPGGSRIELVSRSERIPVSFGFDDRDKGVEVVKKDRAAVRRLRDSGLAFRLEP